MELVTEKYLKAWESKSEQNTPQEFDPDYHPDVYIHERCGKATQLSGFPRTVSLRDPNWYFLGTICVHCGGGVPEEHCVWEDTGENLAAYKKRLTRRKSYAYHLIRWSPVWIGILFAAYIGFQQLQKPQPLNVFVGFPIWTLMAAVILWFPMRILRVLLCLLKII